VFSAKSPINYGDLGVSESLQDIYKRGQAFSIKGDNFSWSYVGISFSYGDKKAIYGRALKSDGTYDPQMIPELVGIELDLVDVKDLENQLRIFDGNAVKLPAPGNPTYAKSTGGNPLSLSAKNLQGAMTGGGLPAGLKKVDGVQFISEYDIYNYRIVHKGKLHGVNREPATDNKSFLENLEKAAPKKKENPFVPVDEQNKEEGVKMKEAKKYTGGFDILEKLVEDQKKDMPIRKESAGMGGISTGLNTNSTSTSITKELKHLDTKQKVLKEVQKNLDKIDKENKSANTKVSPQSVIGRFLGGI